VTQICKSSRETETRDNELGNNADPSVYSSLESDGTFNISSQRTPAPGTSAFHVSACCSEREYVINEFLGFTNGSPSILDTNILGQMEIVLTLHNGNTQGHAT
jgi:hypothetical protein